MRDVEKGGRLVQNDCRSFLSESAGDPNALPFPTGKRVGVTQREIGDAGVLQCFIDSELVLA